MGTVVVKAGHVQPVWAGHPWVFAQAVERVEGGALAGDDVEVRDPRGNSLGRGLYSPGSAIPVRLYTRDAGRAVDGALFAERIARAVERRAMFGLPSDETSAFRLVHAEGDDLPGLIVDRLGDVLSIQIGTIGVKRREAAVLDVSRDRLHLTLNGFREIVSPVLRRGRSGREHDHRKGAARLSVDGSH